ncbi:hypothetical protein ACHAXR_002602 [Thalassiosira sp. AJA248-18]
MNEIIKRQKSLTKEETRLLMLQIVDAVSTIPIHRNLKLGNLFLGKTMNIKVGDFGIAWVLFALPCWLGSHRMRVRMLRVRIGGNWQMNSFLTGKANDDARLLISSMLQTNPKISSKLPSPLPSPSTNDDLNELVMMHSSIPGLCWLPRGTHCTNLATGLVTISGKD